MTKAFLSRCGAACARLLTVGLLLSCVACDQVSKQVAFRELAQQPTKSYWGDVLRVGLAENRGAFLGLGGSWPEPLRIAVFTVLPSAFVIGAVFWLVQLLRRMPPRLNFTQITGITLLVAGGAGNLIDRWFRDGAVIDFLNLGLGSLRTGIFNVADVHIMIGLGLVVLSGNPGLAEGNAPVESSK